MWFAPSRKSRGFTLIELMIAVMVIGLMSMAAIPMFAVWVGNQKIRTAAESVYAGLQIAKQEAVRRNARVLFAATDPATNSWTICPVGPGTMACDGAQPAIQVRDGAEESNRVRIGATTDVSQTNPGAFTTGLTGGAGLPAQVMFDATGRTVIAAGFNNAVRFDFRDTDLELASKERRMVVVVSTAGSPRMCDPQVPAGTPRSC
jgi:type IV fimbrial biogenesis protein FimT